MTLAGKVALVTGASRGIGKGVALQLADAGAIVYITARTVNPNSGQSGTLNQTVEEIQSRGGKAFAIACDHSIDDDVEKLFQRIQSEQGRLDILVNNAYTGVAALYENFGKPFWQIDESIWDACNHVGLRNHYLCATKAAKMMVKQKSGFIVNISAGGAKNFFLTPAYCIGKAAKDRMAADCALELKPYHVTFISLWPGPVRTETLQNGPAEPGSSFAPASTETLGLGLNRYVLESANWKGESIEFSGKCIVSLAQDQQLLEKSGKVFTTAEVGEEYGLLDVDGEKVYKSIFES